MKNIVEMLDTLANEPGKLAKVDLLKTYMQDEQFRIVVEMALDETLHYNINKLPQNVIRNSQPDFDSLMDYLYFLSSKQGATKKEKIALAAFAVDSDWERIITLIIKKDLKCGCRAKLINKAYPGSITEIPYCGCKTSKHMKSINLPAFAQIKEDGLFANIFCNPRKITYMSRNGNEFIFPEDSLSREIEKYFPKYEQTMVYMGEFRIKVDGKWLPRKTGNGIVNKALKKNQTMLETESVKVHFICWDIIPETDFWEIKCDTVYSDRFKKLEFLKDIDSTRIKLSETRIIDDVKEAQDWAVKLIDNVEEEGVIIKNFNSLWKHAHVPSQIKLKAGDLGLLGKERECELKIVEWYFGKEDTKFENCLGGLVCQSEDGLLEVRVGGGYSQFQRGFLGWDENNKPKIIEDFNYWVEAEYMDKIITCRFNEVIKAKTSKKHSLFSSRFIEIRDDKTIADTLKYIQEEI